jgi:hypothetical protein
MLFYNACSIGLSRTVAGQPENWNVRMQQHTKRPTFSIAVAIIFLMSLPQAIAQRTTSDAARATAEPLKIKLVRSKVVLENGKEETRTAEVARPGDIIEETATYVNVSGAPLKSVEATLPVPVNTELLVDSVKPANARASTDGKFFFKLPLTRKQRQPNGVEVEQPVPLSEYRFLRWYPGVLSPDKPLSFSARFRVADNSTRTSSAVR